MCVIVFDFQQGKVILGSNRDESPTRKTTSPAELKGKYRFVVAGEDRGHDGSNEKIGSWLGYNEHGVIVAVVNQSADRRKFPKSRGLICTGALGRCASAAEAIGYVRSELSAEVGLAFYVIIDARQAAFVIHLKGCASTSISLTQGRHVLASPVDRISAVKQMIGNWPLDVAVTHNLLSKLAINGDKSWVTRSSSVISMDGGKVEFSHKIYENFTDAIPHHGSFVGSAVSERRSTSVCEDASQFACHG